MITRRTFIRTSALAAAGLALAGGPLALSGCAPDADAGRHRVHCQGRRL